MIKSNLKEIIDARGWTIREFSRRVGYRFESVRQLYNGTMTRIPVELLDRACRELNCPIGAIITWIDDKEYEGMRGSSSGPAKNSPRVRK